MVVYCEIVDDDRGFMWRVVADCGDKCVAGEWQTRHDGFATLRAPTGTKGGVETWVAFSSYYDGDTFEGFVPYRVEASKAMVRCYEVARPRMWRSSK